MPQFYLVRHAGDLDEELENAVFEAGSDDSLLTMRGENAPIWVTDRQGLVRDALAQAKEDGLRVSHVEIENEVFA
jgi:hypothetical protein